MRQVSLATSLQRHSQSNLDGASCYFKHSKSASQHAGQGCCYSLRFMGNFNFVRKSSILLNCVWRASIFQTKVLNSEVLRPHWHPNSLGASDLKFMAKTMYATTFVQTVFAVFGPNEKKETNRQLTSARLAWLSAGWNQLGKQGATAQTNRTAQWPNGAIVEADGERPSCYFG